MLSKLMKKAINVFDKEMKNKGVEIRDVLMWEYLIDKAAFKITCNLLALNKYYYVIISVNSTNNEYTISDLHEE